MKIKSKTKTISSPSKYKADKPKRNKFEGAKDIYVTKNKIAVKRIRNVHTPTGFIKQEKTKYYVKNNENMRDLKKATGGIVRRGARGNNYINLA